MLKIIPAMPKAIREYRPKQNPKVLLVAAGSPPPPPDGNGSSNFNKISLDLIKKIKAKIGDQNKLNTTKYFNKNIKSSS